ncbi:pupal cuticle protein G1A-like [Calliphora vicina]|uniref:pupal cuticle protein G1A-like n=1 Tax=Calliphora vicina TaxID=7373 RepID=UPI00325BA50E
MFKLFVLAALFAVATARPGYLGSSPVLYSSPTYIQEPAFASYGSIVKSIPTAVSHQSISQVHSSAHYVQPIVAPIVKTTYVAPVHTSYAAAPLYKTYAHEAPLLHSYNAGTVLKSYAPTYGGHYSQW